MSLPELTQATNLLERSARTLLIVPEKTSTDAFASLVALYLALADQAGKEVNAVSPSHVPTNLQFLPGSSQVQMKPREQTDVVLELAGPTAIATVQQESINGGTRLHVMLPEGTAITQDQLEITIRQLPYDLVVVLGVSDLEALGAVFTNHADFFYNTPIINIDHRADNEHFGTVNMVDITAGSVAEVTSEIIQALKKDNLLPEIATALYAGIVDGTDSFQKPSTSPRSFQLAAQLMEAKADRESVIQHLVKTKPLSLIKFSGRLYARLRYDEHIKLFWSVVRPIDFQDSGAKDSDISSAMQELANNIAGFNAAFLLQEKADTKYEMHLLLGKGLRQRRQAIQDSLKAKRDNGLLHVPVTATTLEAAEQETIDKIRNILR